MNDAKATDAERVRPQHSGPAAAAAADADVADFANNKFIFRLAWRRIISARPPSCSLQQNHRRGMSTKFIFTRLSRQKRN